ncbi:MAG: hypothetical protein WCT31_02785 [Candidatus Micrarchaeia archaeon]
MVEEKELVDFGKPLADKAKNKLGVKTDQDYLKQLLELTKKDPGYYAQTKDEKEAVSWALGKLGSKSVQDFQKKDGKIKVDDLAGRETAGAMLKKLKETGEQKALVTEGKKRIRGEESRGALETDSNAIRGEETTGALSVKSKRIRGEETSGALSVGSQKIRGEETTGALSVESNPIRGEESTGALSTTSKRIRNAAEDEENKG